MNPQQIQAMIDASVKKALAGWSQDARYTTKNESYHTHNGIDSPLLDYVPTHGTTLIVAKDTNGTTPVNIFTSFGAPYNFTVTGVFLIAKDTTAGNITVVEGGNTIATVAKGTVSGVLVGATSLANTSVPKGTSFTTVSSSAGNATVMVLFKIT